MGKGDRKKKLPILEDIPKRQPNGQARSRRKGMKDPQKNGLSARCRIFGVEDSLTNRKRLRAPHMCCQIGMVMEHVLGEEPGGREKIDRLWQTLLNLSIAYGMYQRHYLGIKSEPACMNIMHTQEYQEIMNAYASDLRTEEDKARDAANNWMRWQGFMGKLDARKVSLIHHARLDKAELWISTGKECSNCGQTLKPKPSHKGREALLAVAGLLDASAC